METSDVPHHDVPSMACAAELQAAHVEDVLTLKTKPPSENSSVCEVIKNHGSPYMVFLKSISVLIY